MTEKKEKLSGLDTSVSLLLQLQELLSGLDNDHDGFAEEDKSVVDVINADVSNSQQEEEDEDIELICTNISTWKVVDGVLKEICSSVAPRQK